ncbi:hypothetical protein Tco_0245337, partial [Tanacetum coccineum]
GIGFEFYEVEEVSLGLEIGEMFVEIRTVGKDGFYVEIDVALEGDAFKGELRCDSGDWDRDGDSDVIGGGGGRLEICRSEMVVVQKRKKKEIF